MTITPKPDKCEQCGHEVDLGDDVMLVDELWICHRCAFDNQEESMRDIDKEMLNEDPRDYYDDPHITGYCNQCGKRCTSITEDYGIGSYEFWGARGTHHAYVEVSPCCEGEVMEVAYPCEAGCIYFGDYECYKGIDFDHREDSCPQFEPRN